MAATRHRKARRAHLQLRYAEQIEMRRIADKFQTTPGVPELLTTALAEQWSLAQFKTKTVALLPISSISL